VLVLLASALSARSSAVWYCEGRACGITLWECCCTPESATCDLPPEARRALPESATTGCATKCSCVMVERALDQNLATRQTVPLIEAPTAHLPLTPAPEVVCSDSAARVIETRGPPLRHVSLPPLGLRAPPSA